MVPHVFTAQAWSWSVGCGFPSLALLCLGYFFTHEDDGNVTAIFLTVMFAIIGGVAIYQRF